MKRSHDGLHSKVTEVEEFNHERGIRLDTDYDRQTNQVLAYHSL